MKKGSKNPNVRSGVENKFKACLISGPPGNSNVYVIIL